MIKKSILNTQYQDREKLIKSLHAVLKSKEEVGKTKKCENILISNLIKSKRKLINFKKKVLNRNVKMDIMQNVVK